MSRRGQEPDGDRTKLRSDSPVSRTAHFANGGMGPPTGPSGPSGGLGQSSAAPRRFPRGKFNPQRTFHLGPSAPKSKFNPTKTFTPTAPTSPTPGSSPSNGHLGGQLGNQAASTAMSAPTIDPGMYHAPLHPLQYHLYAPTPFRSRSVVLEAHERTPDMLFISNQLREELQERNEATLQILAASSLPEFVHVYHSLVPLDVRAGSTEKFGYPTWRYKAVSNTDGRTYCLLRVDGFQLQKEHALQVVNKWKRVMSSAVVGVVEAFTTLAFGGPSLILVYEYWPLARPLQEVYQIAPPEGLMWSFVAQLFGAIQVIHKRQLAVRVIDAKRVLVTQKDRLRIGSCGVLDVVDYDEFSSSVLAERQRQDWRDLAAMISSLVSPTDVADKYSADFARFVQKLEQGESAELATLLAPHLWRVLDGALSYDDELEEILANELENARLVRLLSKLEFVIDRPEQADDPDWSPTGKMYPLLLFKHFAFHTLGHDGRPCLNLAHAIAVLNKLDAGINENMLLVSPDERTRIIISYKDVKRMVEEAFAQLKA